MLATLSVSQRQPRFIVSLVKENDKTSWSARVMLLFHRFTQTNDKIIAMTSKYLKNANSLNMMSGELAFLRYFDFTPPVDNFDGVLNCLFIRWETDYKFRHTLSLNRRGDDAIDAISVGEWYGVILVSLIRSVHHIVRRNCFIQPFTSQHLWSLHQFHFLYFISLDNKGF